MSIFNWLTGNSQDLELPDIYPMPISQLDFVMIDMQNIYARIITDVMERCDGIQDEQQNLLCDNCLGSENQDGLITMIAKAMVMKRDLFLVYLPALKLIREATATEAASIREDYKAKGESPIGVFITFRNYRRTDMVRFYSMLEYCSVGGIWKQSNISMALQMKFTDLRASTGLSDSADVKVQGRKMADGLAAGKSIMMDAKDTIETAKPDLTASQLAMDLINQKRSFYLGLPACYLTGELTSGLGESGNKDSKAVERGLRSYYFSIAKPVLEGIFSIKTSFKSDDFDELATSLEALKTFDITSDDYLSKENKTEVINKIFGLPEDSVGDPPAEPVAPIIVQPVPPMPPNPKDKKNAVP